MKVQKRMQFITSSRLTYKDSLSINTYEYQVNFENLPIRKNQKGKMISQIASQQKRKKSQDAFQLINFVEQFQHKINIAYKTAKIYPSFKQKEQIKKFILLGFMKEVLIFISFIYKNTIRYQRETELYNLKNKIYFRWDINKQSSISSYTFAEKFEEELINLRFNLYIRENEKYKHQFQKKPIKIEQSVDEKISIQRFISHLLGKNPEYIVIKGKLSMTYILHNNTILGKGGFGFVNMGQEISISDEDEIIIEECAIKVCKKSMSEYKSQGYSISQERQHKMLRKIHQMCNLKMLQDSKYIINLREVVEQSDKKYLIYEYCMYNSLKQYSKREIFNPKQIFQIGFQLIKTLKLIHHQLIKNEEEFYKFSEQIPNDKEVTDDIERFSKILNKQGKDKGIIHRDLKLNNILLKQISQGHVLIKVIDWAFSKRTYIDESMSKIQCGTAQYHAPQVEERRQYSAKVDIWAFGAIMFEIINMKPFYDRNKAGIKKRAEEEIDKIKFDQKSFKKEQIYFWKNVLKRAMKYQQKDRCNAIQIFNLFKNFEIYKQWSQQEEECFLKIVNIHQQFSLSRQFIQKEYCKTLMQLKVMRQSNQIIQTISPLLIKYKIQGKIGLQHKHIAYAKQTTQRAYGGLTMDRAIKKLQMALNFISYTCSDIIDPSLIKFLIEQCKRYCK